MDVFLVSSFPFTTSISLISLINDIRLFLVPIENLILADKATQSRLVATTLILWFVILCSIYTVLLHSCVTLQLS